MLTRHILTALAAIAATLALCMCSPSTPTDARIVAERPSIYPDYDGATIPCNIAPLNFTINEEGDQYVSRIHAKGEPGFNVAGRTLDIDPAKWRELLARQKGDTVLVDIFVRDSEGWHRYPAIKWAVAEEIDPYISYRQIEPSYIGFEVMRICQRNLENFDQTEIFNNCAASVDQSGQCINCHSYQDYNRTGKMQMHVRINNGGTILVDNDQAKKVNLKTPATISAGVYPSWHPTLPLIAYSVNTTNQNFHSRSNNKVEVQDGASDLVLYAVENNRLHIIANDSTELETFPYWNHDGTALYYASATIPYIADPDDMVKYKRNNYRDFKYNIYRRPFDSATLTFGPVDTVFNAAALGKSATFPRESRDGRYLVFTLAEYGTFHIWHHDADLYLLDLATGEARPLSEVNSRDTESYHSFSSNGNWLIFSSRRDDGSFTRLYLAHFGPDGKAGKPFLLPQRHPDQNLDLYKSYNIPEFMAAPATATRPMLLDAIASEAQQAELARP